MYLLVYEVPCKKSTMVKEKIVEIRKELLFQNCVCFIFIILNRGTVGNLILTSNESDLRYDNIIYILGTMCRVLGHYSRN